MRWNRRKAKSGEVRYTIRFAWRPIYTNDSKTIWMEKYIARHSYTYYNDGIAHWYLEGRWSRESDQWKEMYIDILKKKQG